MCGRYAITKPVEALRDLFAVSGPIPDYGPRYNIAPGQAVPVIRTDESGRRVAVVRWGLVPHWAKEPPQPPPINARCETAATKPMFRDSFAHRRCLVPADGFFEWVDEGRPRKQPMYIQTASRETFAMAGLWAAWTPPAGPPLETMAILTMAASPDIARLHDRMPVILQPSAWAAWLDPATPREALEGLLRSASASAFVAHPVGLGVNRVANDDAALIAAITPAAGVAPAAPARPGAGAPRRIGQLDLF